MEGAMPVPRQRKTYVAPQLTVHGTVEEITAGCDKTLGDADGFTFMGQSIVCSS
jgi:hypothetical protein